MRVLSGQTAHQGFFQHHGLASTHPAPPQSLPTFLGCQGFCKPARLPGDGRYQGRSLVSYWPLLSVGRAGDSSNLDPEVPSCCVEALAPLHPKTRPGWGARLTHLCPRTGGRETAGRQGGLGEGHLHWDPGRNASEVRGGRTPRPPPPPALWPGSTSAPLMFLQPTPFLQLRRLASPAHPAGIYWAPAVCQVLG